MKKQYRADEIVVMEKVIDDMLNFIDVDGYKYIDENITPKEILELEMKNASNPHIDSTLRAKTDRLVEGGFFRVYNHDILEFLESLNLHDSFMKRAKKEPFEAYKGVMYHAIKRYVKA